jgi:alpha-mannosidase
VEAHLTFPEGTPKVVRVLDSEGHEVPSQIEEGKVIFLAKVPSVGYAVYSVSPAADVSQATTLKVANSSLENARYLIRLDEQGDVSSIYDKDLKKQLLAGPIRLAISNDAPKVYPAWNMDFEDEQTPPRAYVGGAAKIRVAEAGPVRIALEVSRETENSKFVQTIRLSAGDAGNRVEFGNAIDWRTLSANLKATFPLSATNPNATYNWEIGTIQRPNAQERQFEVASHRWIDLLDKTGTFGTTILTDCKNGSDKPNDNTIRLTLLRSPGMQPPPNGRPQPYSDQANQDWGHHEFVFGLIGHKGTWQQAQTDWQAYRLNDPLIAFQTEKHPGALGKSFSLVHLSSPRIRVLALKKAEANDDIVLRMVELDGKPAEDVHVTFAGPITSAQEIDAQERFTGQAKVIDGSLVTSFTAYQPRTFALHMGGAASKLRPRQSQPVPLNFDVAVATNDDTATNGAGFDGKGNAMPAEMLPSTLNFHDVQFKLGEAKTGVPNAVAAKGQTIELPAGHYNRVYILAASVDGDQIATFEIGGRKVQLKIQDWTGFIGQWDTRIWKNQSERDWAISANHAPWPPADLQSREQRPISPRYPEDYVGLEPGYVKTAELAWYASHQHTPQGLNQPYHYSYLFAYPIDVPTGARSLRLPSNEKIRVLAISTADETPGVQPAQPLYDTLNRSGPAPNSAE